MILVLDSFGWSLGGGVGSSVNGTFFLSSFLLLGGKLPTSLPLTVLFEFYLFCCSNINPQGVQTFIFVVSEFSSLVLFYFLCGKVVFYP